MEEWYAEPRHAHLRFEEFKIIRDAYKAAAAANSEELHDVQMHPSLCGEEDEEDEADSVEVRSFPYAGFSLSVRLCFWGTYTGALAP